MSARDLLVGRSGPRTRLERARPLALLVCLAACTNVITPPEHPRDPLPVFVLDHGRHASLVLPAGDSALVRYAYGDWTYYARRKTGALEASTAVLVPTPAGLGRREVAGEWTADGVYRAVKPGIEFLHEVAVDAAAAQRLRRRLDFIFEETADGAIYNPAYDLEFANHPEPYTILHNSNRMVATWLRELGCEVRGLLLFSHWRVEPAENRR